MSMSRFGRIAASLTLAAALTLEATGAIADEGAAGAPDGLTTILAGETAPGGLTAEQAARRAVATSHEVDESAEEARAAREDESQAKGAWLPRNTLTFKYSRLSHVDETPGLPFAADHPDRYSYRSEISVPASDYLLRIPHTTRAAELSTRAARDFLSATRHDVDLDARLAYYEWVRARFQVRVAEQSLAQARKHATTAHHSAEIGTATRADVLRVDAQVAEANLTLERARNNEVVAREELRSLLHDGDEAVYKVGEDLLRQPEALAQDFAALWREAREHRPELRATKAQAASLDQQASSTTSAWMPRVDLVAGFDYANPNTRTFPLDDTWSNSWDMTVQMTWVPTDLMSGRAGTRAARARAGAAHARARQAEDAVRNEVIQAYERYRGARTAVEASTISLAAAEEAYRVRQGLFENGRATSLELTDAELSLTQARIDAVDARVDLYVSMALIAHAVGTDRK